MTISDGLAMSWEEWHEHDAVGLAGLVRAGILAPKEVCAQAAEAVARVDSQIEAVLGLYEDVIADPDKDQPSKEARLYGVPILLKDLGSGLSGRTQESGSKLFKDHVVQATDPLVENYLGAGLIPIGRSTTPEFGMTFDTATDYLGRLRVTRNPWRLERTPGGSSGGSAAAVAAFGERLGLWAFWLYNAGLALWILLNFFPIGWLQLAAVYEHGLAYARSVTFYDTTLFWQWMRLPGDVVFAVAALMMAWDFVIKARPLLPSAVVRWIPGSGPVGSPAGGGE